MARTPREFDRAGELVASVSVASGGFLLEK
jgi:hypothetical protein